MVDDPSAHPDLFPTEKAQEKERQRLFRIIEELVKWENTTNEAVLQAARDEIWQSWRCTLRRELPTIRGRKNCSTGSSCPYLPTRFSDGGACRWRRSGWRFRALYQSARPVLINKRPYIPPAVFREVSSSSCISFPGDGIRMTRTRRLSI